MVRNKTRLLFVQYGDYREAIINFMNGGEETYNSQKYSVDFVAELSHKYEYVGVMCLATSEIYDEKLPNGVHVIGVNYSELTDMGLIDYIETCSPTHIILCTPKITVINWACDNNIKILPLLADSFNKWGVRQFIYNVRLRSSLNSNCIPWVANHNIGASTSLKKIGVTATKIIPWDWPAQINPEQFADRSLSDGKDSISLLYIGTITEDKGVGDCIEAMSLFQKRSKNIKLDVIGGGEIEKFRERVTKNGLDGVVNIIGKVSRKRVLDEMLAHDIVVVPSRHSYPEGLPMVLYEALCTKTPLVISDHPMFLTRFTHEVNAVVFQAGNPKDMEEKITKLIADKDLYKNISNNSSKKWQELQIPLKWGELVKSWTDNPSRSNKFLRSYSLNNYNGTSYQPSESHKSE